MERNCRICTAENCDCLCSTCRRAALLLEEQKTTLEAESIEIVDKNGVAHGYTEEDEKLHDS